MEDFYDVLLIVPALRCPCAPLSLRSVVPALRCPCAPLSLRSVVACLCLALLLAAPNVRAGSYYGSSTDPTTGKTVTTPTFTGGEVDQFGPPTFYTPPTGNPYGGVGGAPGGANCNGKITATFTWLPDAHKTMTTDPPPASVIVQETSHTSATGTNISPAGSPPMPVNGTCDNGLVPAVPLAQVTSGDGTAQHPYSVTGSADSSSTRYKTMAGGPTVTLTCTPQAQATGNNGTGVSVSYSANVTPVFVFPSGAIQDSSDNWNILVGQGCTSHLSSLSSANFSCIPSGCTATYSWSVSGTTFQDWEPTTPAFPNASPPTLANSQASYFSGGPGPLTNSTAHWYWDDPIVKPTPETVTCTATLTPPTGQGTAFNVTATTKVTVYIPAYTAAGIGGDMEVNKADLNDTSHYNLWAEATDQRFDAGMNFQATVTTPSPPAFGTGSLELVQLVTPNNSYTTVANPTTTVSDPNNGILGLDATYPYGYDIATEKLAPALTYQNNDAPRMQLDGNVVLDVANKNGSYVDYLMYKPPGPDSQWIPLAQYNWSANGSATIPTTKNWADYVKQNGTDIAGTVDPVGVTDFTDIVGPLNFPSWIHIDGSGSF